jgi:hypothetical protein
VPELREVIAACRKFDEDFAPLLVEKARQDLLDLGIDQPIWGIKMAGPMPNGIAPWSAVREEVAVAYVNWCAIEAVGKHGRRLVLRRRGDWEVRPCPSAACATPAEAYAAMLKWQGDAAERDGGVA